MQFAAALLASGGGEPAWRGARSDHALWALLRACLGDEEAASRKRAAHVLALALQQEQAENQQQAQGQQQQGKPPSQQGGGGGGQLAPAWRSLFKLLEGLDELAPHLVAASRGPSNPWLCGPVCLTNLHAADPQDALHTRASLPLSLQDAWSEMDRLHAAESTAAAAAGAAPAGVSGSGGEGLEWSWLEVVWGRGLRHEEQQVRAQPCSLGVPLAGRWCLLSGLCLSPPT